MHSKRFLRRKIIRLVGRGASGPRPAGKNIVHAGNGPVQAETEDNRVSLRGPFRPPAGIIGFAYWTVLAGVIGYGLLGEVRGWRVITERGCNIPSMLQQKFADFMGVPLAQARLKPASETKVRSVYTPDLAKLGGRHLPLRSGPAATGTRCFVPSHSSLVATGRTSKGLGEDVWIEVRLTTTGWVSSAYVVAKPGSDRPMF